MTQLWARVECLCGRVAAIPEMGFFPVCGECGRKMVAPVGPGRFCYVIDGPLPVNEALALEEVHERGVDVAAMGHERLYADEVLRADLYKRGFETEPQR